MNDAAAPYPPDFQSWPLEQRNEYFARETKRWRESKASTQSIRSPTTSQPSDRSYVSHGDFIMDKAGLFVGAATTKKSSFKNGEPDKIWVCDPFELIGRVRDPTGSSWSRLLRWRDADGRWHDMAVADAELHGETSALCQKLASRGLRIATGRGPREKFVAYLNGARVDARVTMVDRTGWHRIANVDAFVLPGGSIGAPVNERILLSGGAAAPFGTKGDLAGWRESVGRVIGEHSRLVLAVSTALAGPLLHLTGQDGFGVNLFGKSSRGKTTALQAAASVWGGVSCVRAWRATANALEGAAALASDTLLVLDEIGTVEARDAGAATYALADGRGKGRAGRDGTLRESKSWRVIVLSSGELPMAAKVAEGGRRAMAGQSVRMVDIDADAGKGFGCFDAGHEGGDAAPIANAIKSAVRDFHGTAGPEFVRRVVAEGVETIAGACKAAVAAFVETNVPTASDGQVSRVAARLGLLGVAGELATSFGVTDWRVGAAMDAAKAALCGWIDARGGVEPSEDAAALAAVRRFIEAHGTARFEPADAGPDDRVVVNRAGYRKGCGEAQEWWCLPEVWKSEICSGHDPVAVAKALAARGMLRRQADKLQCKVRVGERTVRAYAVTASIFTGAGDD